MSPFRHIGVRRIHLESTDSTNNRAAEFAEDSAYSGTIITADVQSQGRGQHGRTWHSEPGMNLLLSVLIFPPVELRRPAVLTAFAAVCVAETIETFADRTATVKWPNDVLVDGKKASGILIESGSRPGALPFFVIGIGMNVNQSLSDFARLDLPHATSLAALTGGRLSMPDVCTALIRRLDDCYDSLLKGNIRELERDWSDRLGKTGRDVIVELMDANQIQGRLVSVSFEAVELERSDGSMLTIRPETVRHINSNCRIVS